MTDIGIPYSELEEERRRREKERERKEKKKKRKTFLVQPNRLKTRMG